MKFTDKQSLAEYRAELAKSNSAEDYYGVPVELYGVYTHLGVPVVKFTSISKKHLYTQDKMKYDYPIRSRDGFTVFTSASEAWRYFRDLLQAKKDELDAHYKAQMMLINIANNLVSEHSEKNPEYFL